MKKVMFATVSLCIVAAAAAPAVAFAAEAPPAYPDIYDYPLTFEALSDYAVGGENTFAFADGKEILYLENENLTRYSFDSDISALDYSNGVFYYSLKGDETVYSLSDRKPSDYVMTDFGEDIYVGNTLQYYYNSDTGALTLLYRGETSGESTVVLDGCTRIKKYNDILYVIKDNSLKTLNEDTTSDVEVLYSNYGSLASIPLGDAPQKLNTYATYGQNTQVVNIKEGATATLIDLNKLNTADGVFPVSDPRASTRKLSEGQALLLCETGTVRIIAQGQNCYMLNAADATDFTYVPLTPVAHKTTATVVAEEYAHALPFMSNATRSFKVKASETVEVLYSVSVEDVPVLAHNFYLIKNTDNKYGYIPEEFLKELNYQEGGASTITDPSPSYDDNVRTVVLILVVIVLALIAAGYVTWVITSGKRKKVKKNADGEVDVTKEEKEDETE